MARCNALAFLFFSLFFCTPDIASADPDFYYFVLQWPGSYCKDYTVKRCCKPTTPSLLDVDFLVKGLYTYSASGQPLTKCNTTKFYVNALASLISDLYVHWPSIECPSNNGVSKWKEAWTNYGVCSGLIEKDYFQKALELRTKINMKSVLKWKGIFPSDIIFYSPLYVRTAIRLGIGADVAIKCNKNIWGAYQIHEIYMCVDKTATKVIKCPVLPKFDCGHFAFLPSFSNDMLKNTSTVKMVASE